jgi:hypothetical protein
MAAPCGTALRPPPLELSRYLCPDARRLVAIYAVDACMLHLRVCMRSQLFVWPPLCWPVLGCQPQFGTLFSPVYTLLSVYVGNTLGSLTLLASNDDCTPGVPGSCVTLTVAALTVYTIRVATGVGMGTFTLTATAVPANDLFAAPAALPFSGSNAGASIEPDELSPAPDASGQTIWLQFTSPPTPRTVQVCSSTGTLQTRRPGTATSREVVSAKGTVAPSEVSTVRVLCCRAGVPDFVGG